MKTFKHKSILITGASSGIGRAMALQLCDPTVTLLLTSRSEDELNDLAQQVQKYDTRAAIFPIDLSAPGKAEELFNSIKSEGFSVDVLINNAGFGIFGNFDDYSVEQYESMLGINVVNLVSLTRLVIPYMLEAGDAGILNVASTAAFQPLPYFSAYAAAKSFVLSFSEALHGEYRGRGITITCLCPGPTGTRFARKADIGKPFSALFTPPPEDIARIGLQSLLQKKMTTVKGFWNISGSVLGRLTPRTLLVPIMARALQSSCN